MPLAKKQGMTPGLSEYVVEDKGILRIATEMATRVQLCKT
jgi:hypothetical protein